MPLRGLGANLPRCARPTATRDDPLNCYHFIVNSKHRKTLQAVLLDPVTGNLPWDRIEALLVALGCRVVEGPGSSVTFDWQGRKASFQRPHPGKEAPRYRIKAVREFLAVMGVTI